MNIQVVTHSLNSTLTYLVTFLFKIVCNLARTDVNCKTSNDNIPDIWANLRCHTICT